MWLRILLVVTIVLGVTGCGRGEPASVEPPTPSPTPSEEPHGMREPGAPSGFDLAAGRWDAWTATNEINDLTVGPDGTLWAASAGGVVAWRGDRPEIHGVVEGWPTLAARSVDVGPDGTVWVGLQHGGVSALRSGVWQTYTVADGLGRTGPEHGPWEIAVTTDGQVWAGDWTSGLYRLDGDRFVAVELDLPSHEIRSLAAGQDGTLLVGTWAGAVVAGRDGEAQRRTDLPVAALAPAGDDPAAASLWVGAWDPDRQAGGLWRVASGDVPRATGIGEEFLVWDLATDGDGVYAVGGVLSPGGTGHPLLWHVESTGAATAIPGPWDELPPWQLLDVALDTADRTLFVSGVHGVWKVRQGGAEPLLTDTFPSGATILDVAADGTAWAGSSSHLAVCDGTGWQTVETPFGPGVGAPPIAGAGGAGRRLWVGFGAGPDGDPTLGRFDGDGWTLFDVDPNLAPWIAHVPPCDEGCASAEQVTWPMALSSDGVLWVSAGPSAAGLWRVEARDWSHHTVADGLPDADIAEIAVEPDGTPWVRTHHGVARLAATGDGWTRRHLPAADDVLGLAIGPQGTVALLGVEWVARRDDGAWRVFDRPDPDGHAGERALGVDAWGGLWLSSATGAVRVSDDGVLQVALPGGPRPGSAVLRAWTPSDGSVWLLTAEGLYRWRPAHG